MINLKIINGDLTYTLYDLKKSLKNDKISIKINKLLDVKNDIVSEEILLLCFHHLKHKNNYHLIEGLLNFAVLFELHEYINEGNILRKFGYNSVIFFFF